ncbi:hypothetical protein, partial [Candidatus Hamiltonella defensa]|uniref:hypothetical protein n=1 Tax=Candidatus Williamhamiltonella defendens TaxID=138072 RepID=UPI001582A524
MRYKKITLHTLRLSVLTMLIHSGGSVSETTVFDGVGTHELTEQAYLEGIEARNQAQVNNRPGQPLSLSSPETGKAAVQVTGEGTSVMLEGTEKQKITVDTEADGGAYGLWAIDKSTLTLKHMDITLKGTNDIAVAVETGAKVDIRKSTLSINGDNSSGTIAHSSEITLKDSSLRINGGNSSGIASGGTARVTGHHLDIKAEGQRVTAIYANHNSTVDIQDSTLSSIGENTFGIVAENTARVTGHHLDIKAEGQNVTAIYANDDSTVDIQNSTLSSIGDNAWGIVATARVTGNDLDIKVEGQGANAVATNGNATIHLHDSHIQTLATPSAVLYSETGATDTTVTITGGSLHAAGDLIVSKGGKTNLVFSKV